MQSYIIDKYYLSRQKKGYKALISNFVHKGFLYFIYCHKRIWYLPSHFITGTKVAVYQCVVTKQYCSFINKPKLKLKRMWISEHHVHFRTLIKSNIAVAFYRAFYGRRVCKRRTTRGFYVYLSLFLSQAPGTKFSRFFRTLSERQRCNSGRGWREMRGEGKICCALSFHSSPTPLYPFFYIQ